MRVAVFLLLLIASVHGYQSLLQQWSDYTTKFNKQYATAQAEFEAQQNYFLNLERIAELRKNHEAEFGENADHIYGINKFTDMSPEEFKMTYLGFRPKAANKEWIDIHPVKRIANPPAKWDWFTEGACTPVKDQGQCGSCWAFSATEEIESMWIRSNHSKTVLSEQQIVSCDQNDAGCGGGDTITAYEYVQQAGGLETEADYPYTSGNSGANGQCKFSASKTVVTVTNYSYAVPPCTGSCNSQNEDLLATQLYSVGPVSICVNAEPWQYYTGGVMKSGCSHGYNDLDHCVQLTGYDKTSSPGYWIVRNSWNTDWGIEGFIYLQIGSNLCGVADEATFVATAAA